MSAGEHGLEVAPALAMRSPGLARRLFTGVLAMLAVALPRPGAGQVVPAAFSVSARLEDGGVPMAGPHDFDFALYRGTGAAATLLWGESQGAVPVNDGFVEVVLSAPGLTAAIDQGDLYLEITVDGVTLSPRVQITATPYAMRAANAELLGGVAPTGYLRKGTTLSCAVGDKVVAIDPSTGDVTCAPDQVGTVGVAPGGGLQIVAGLLSIASSGVSSAMIGAGAVGALQLATGAVSSLKIADNSVTGTDIADGTLTGADLADGTVGSVDIADGTVGSVDISDLSIAPVDLAAGAVTSAKIATGAVGDAQLATGAAGLRVVDLPMGTDTGIGSNFEQIIIDDYPGLPYTYEFHQATLALNFEDEANCLVAVTGTREGDGTVLFVGYTRDGSPEHIPESYAWLGSADLRQTVSTQALVPVAPGFTYQFGCTFLAVDFPNFQRWCNVSYVCF